MAVDSGARRVLRSSLVLVVAKVLERATGFIAAVLVAAKLGADGLGVYSAAWAIYGLITLAGDAGATSYLIREISRDPSRTASYTTHISAIAIVVGLLLALLGWIVTPLLGYSQELETSVFVVLLGIVPSILNSIQQAVFVAHSRVGFETLTRLGSSAAYVLAAAWLLDQGYGVPAVLRAFVATECVVASVYFILISRYIARLRLELRWSLARRLLGEIKSYAASSAIAGLFSRPEVLLLSVMSSERQVGLYGAAMRIAELPLLLPEVLMTNVFPLLSRTFATAEDRFASWQAASVRAVLFISLPLAACCLAAAEPIIALVFGEDLSAAAPVLRILALNLVFFSLISVFWRSLVARGRQNANVAIQGATVVVRLAAGAALIAPQASTGAAIAATATGALHLALLVTATARSGAPSAILRAAWRFALAAATAGLAVWALSGAIFLPVALLAGGCVYLAASLAIGAISPADRLLLRQLRVSRAAQGEP